MYSASAYVTETGASKPDLDAAALRELRLRADSPWPSRNAATFELLNAFMERWGLCMWFFSQDIKKV